MVSSRCRPLTRGKCPQRRVLPERLSAPALGLAAALNKDLKLPMRKTCRVLQERFGRSLSPGGLAPATERVATSLQGAYGDRLERLRQSAVIHTDETGWWVGGPGDTLWVFTNHETTYYRIVEHRDRATAADILSDAFQDALVSDCLSIDDGLDGVQQKCYAHHLKALSKALKTEAGQGSSYTQSGATTWSVLASLAATCQQRGDSFIEQVARAAVLQNRAA